MEISNADKRHPETDAEKQKLRTKYIVGIAGLIIAALLLIVFWPRNGEEFFDRTKLEFLTEASYANWFNPLIETYNESQEEVYVEIQYVSFGLVKQSLILAIVGESAPDIFTIPNEDFDYFVEHELLLPLETQDGKQVLGLDYPGIPGKICIFVATENKEAARKFLDYLVEAANEALITPENHSD
ncbi:MAG: extracellular solute-binding protein [Firmicutes bacterium]|jgi:ABC-type glycerol-3-phosphate transport system substrate-binding protein|nr:extracellular solute-binding protein [Bacillota bacterium]